MTTGHGTGFSALQSLTSDVGPALREAQRRSTLPKPDARIPAPHAGTDRPGVASVPRPVPSSSIRWGRVVVAALVVGVIVLINWGSGGGSQSSGVSPTAYSAPVPEAYSTPSNPYLMAAPDVLREQPPAPGDGYRVLSESEIRYCLAEDIRMAAASSALNRYDGSAVSLFNLHVDDYNARCGNYRYRDAAMANARSDVERHRASIEAEGRARF